MKEKYLTLEQNLCAARIFLNTFGLTLENINDVNEFSKIKIFDKNLKEVGELLFDNGKVIISANYNDSILEVNYDIAKMSGFIDTECGNALFGQWTTNISFQVKKGSIQIIEGKFIVDSAIDSEFGIKCFCHPLINSTILGKDKVTLKILREGKMFGLEINSGDYMEIIDIMPWDWLNGFILHDIKIGNYDKEKHAYPYRKYAGIFNGAENGENRDKLHVFLEEEKNGIRLDFYNEFVPKVTEDDTEENLLQKGQLMQQLDPAMYKKVEELRKILFIGDVSLLDNLVSVCYDVYTEKEIYSLLGLKKQAMNYQDGNNSLVNSYFGIGKNSCFFPLEEQKRLLKR